MKRLWLLIPLLCASGCANILHELKPHRLWRLNYYEPLGRNEDKMYSVSDPLPPRFAHGPDSSQATTTPDSLTSAPN